MPLNVSVPWYKEADFKTNIPYWALYPSGLQVYRNRTVFADTNLVGYLDPMSLQDWKEESNINLTNKSINAKLQIIGNRRA